MSKHRGPAKSSDKFGFLEGMIRIGQEALGRQILAAVEGAKWKPEPTADPRAARVWIGEAPGFRFVVADFEIESQGHEGERAADGTVSAPGFAIRLGHALAGRAVLLARRQGGVS